MFFHVFLHLFLFFLRFSRRTDSIPHLRRKSVLLELLVPGLCHQLILIHGIGLYGAVSVALEQKEYKQYDHESDCSRKVLHKICFFCQKTDDQYHAENYFSPAMMISY